MFDTKHAMPHLLSEGSLKKKPEEDDTHLTEETLWLSKCHTLTQALLKDPFFYFFVGHVVCEHNR